MYEDDSSELFARLMMLEFYLEVLFAETYAHSKMTPAEVDKSLHLIAQKISTPWSKEDLPDDARETAAIISGLFG